MSVKISIAITTYNGEKYLREQIDSLYSQTLVPDEIIVVDDCSTDNTQLILEQYHISKGLIYFVNEKNLGINKNFEKALSFCTGDYIALCDQDDIWFPDKLLKSYNKIRQIEYDEPALISSNNIFVDENLKIINIPKFDKDDENYSTTLLGHYSQGCTLFMNKKLKKLIIPFPDDNRMVFDMYIGLVAAMIGNKYYLAEPLMFYRSHSNNAHANVSSVNLSLKCRIKNKYKKKFPGLIPNERYPLMIYVKKMHGSEFKSDRKKLYDKLLKLFELDNIFKEIYTILSIKEISLIKRITILRDTYISRLLKINPQN